MDRSRYQQYFMQPLDPWQRRYEALRAVFVEQRTTKAVAEQFDLHHGTVRNWVSEFCRQQDTGQPPPFSPRRLAGAPAGRVSLRARIPIQTSKSPTGMPCHWRPGTG